MKLARLSVVVLAATSALSSACGSSAAGDPHGRLGASHPDSFETACTAGATRCSGGNSVQVCSSKSKWGKAALCATGECTAGACSGATSSGASCAAGGEGLTTCGPGSQSCCLSAAVPGGTYDRTYTYSGSGPVGEADRATVSAQLLDTYLVTVGRFRQFVAAWDGGAGYLPRAAAGKHAYLNGGKGLANSASAGTYEAGWVASDDGSLAPTDANLACGAPYSTWTSAAGANESLPINCVNWWEAEAFCIWDGGFLPSEAEWELAAAGGAKQLEYPWGKTAPGTDNQYAIFDSDYPRDTHKVLGLANIAPVGTATLGAGLWGQQDLAGEMQEWNLDWFAPYADPCTDCAYVTATTDRVVRGGSFQSLRTTLYPWLRSDSAPTQRSATTGFRCARSPYAGKTTRLTGAIQKGPFIVGSTVLLSSIDDTGTFTGQTFPTQTTDDLGDFGIAFDYAGNLDIQASGFYYNEASGLLSSAPIALRALYEATGSGAQSAHINMITHLAHDRALSLMQNEGMTLAAAETQAEGEVVAALGVGGGFDPGIVGINLDEVGANTVQNAYLFAVSSIFAQAALETAGSGSVDAQLQEILGQIAADLVADGTIDASWTPILRKAEQDVDVDLLTDLFLLRLTAIGSAATPPDMNLAIDTDGDGYRNSVDTCALVANPVQGTIPAGSLCTFARYTTLVPAGSNAFAATSSTPFSIAGDFTHAGHLGLFGCGLHGSTACDGLFTGDGTGHLFPAPTTGVPTGFSPVGAYDVNGDGNLDLVSTSTWLAGDGSGNFSAGGSMPSYLTGGSYSSLWMADLNGDGELDVVEAYNLGQEDFSVLVTYASGVGAFGAPSVLPIPGYTSIALGDMNADGLTDIVAVASTDESTNGTVNVYLNTGITFSPPTSAPLPMPGFGLTTLALGDFNGDGKLDVSVVTNDSSTMTVSVCVYDGDGAGNLGASATTPLSYTTFPIETVASDWDADGKADLFALLPTSTSLGGPAFLSASSATHLQSLRTIPVATSGVPVYGGTMLTQGDWNEDGVLDTALVAPSASGSWSIQIYEPGPLR